MKTVYLGIAQKIQPFFFERCRIFRWYFFSQDFGTFHAIDGQKLPTQVRYGDIGEALQKKAYELKDTYIGFIGQLGEEHAGRCPLAWWSSRVAERNEMISHAFLTVCYYHVFLDLIKEDAFEDKSLILVESIALFKLMVRELKGTFRVVIVGKPYFLGWTFWRPYIAGFSRLSRFFAWMLFKRHKGIRPLSNASGKKKIFVRTWVSDKTISDNGEFRDIYFPGLYDFLKDKGYEVVIMPNFYNMTLTSAELHRRINLCKSPFFISENYLTWKDRLEILRIMVSQAAFRFKNREFRGVDVSCILTETQQKFFFDCAYLFLAQTFALKNLAREGIRIESFVYTFENNFPEKTLNYGIKKYFPMARALGYQHSVLYPLQVGQYPATEEWKTMPLPDEIICSGPFFVQIYAKHGAPREKLVVGPALRFKNLMARLEDKKADREKEQKRPANRLLIAFPMGYSESLELAIKSSCAMDKLSGFKDMAVGLKLHPMVSQKEMETMRAFFKGSHYSTEIIDGSLDSILQNFSLMVTMASGVIFDAMIEGIPVIRVGRSHSLNFDPADFIEDNPYDYKVQTVDELSGLIERLLRMQEEERFEMRRFAERFVEGAFGPVNGQTMAVFTRT